ncbi:MAG: serpin family protein [Bacteroides sp.]|nr:serpin family protein [Bacteroides sp.]
MNKYFSLITLLLGLLFVGCSSDDDGYNDSPVEIVLSRSQQGIVDSQVRFAFDFFKQTSEWAGNEENMVISPISLSVDLAMLANGAGEKTYRDILTALHVPDATTEELNVLYRNLVNDLLRADRKVYLTHSNGMWSDKNVDIKDDFVKNIKDYYSADIKSLDFADSNGSKNAINRWAAEKTNGMIANIFNDDQDLTSTKFILCNALSFAGEWTHPFDKKKTQRQTFSNINDSQSTVDMMISQDIKFPYVSTETAEIVGLPYGNRSFSLYVILPSVGNDDESYEEVYNSFIENLSYEWWAESKEKMTDSELLYVCLPKFKIKTDCPMIGATTLHELKDVVFGPDMSLMTDSPLNMLNINQNNIIEVTETGTVAAVVTKDDLTMTAPLVKSMKANRPFIFLIEEQSTGTILFMGKVVKL